MVARKMSDEWGELFFVLITSIGCNAISGIDEFSFGSVDIETTSETSGETVGDTIVIIDSGSGDSGTDETDTGSDSAKAAETDVEADAACVLSTHSNGLGQAFVSCVPLGTYTKELAVQARAAWPKSGSDSDGSCSLLGVISRYSSSTGCAVWAYDGFLAGKLWFDTKICDCPKLTDLDWK